MASKLDRRAAKMAVANYGAEPDRVREAYNEAKQAKLKGQACDFIEVMVRFQLLTAEQAIELRKAIQKTQLAPKTPAQQTTPHVKITTPTSQDETRFVEPALQLVAGYRLLRKIGEGGMGEVFLAYDEASDTQVALKILSPTLAANPSLVERFRREAQHGIHLNHTNLVRTFAVGQDKWTGRHYLVMEYVDGPSAQSLLDQFGRLKVGDAVHIVLDIALALEHAQSRNIIHRDIKPENILITKSGLAKLADLGLAKQTDQSAHLTATRQGFGTPYYMPYEQSINAKYADSRSDIFALGATLYHIVTGQVPFPGDSPVEVLEKKNVGSYVPAGLINTDVPVELDRILAKMMARKPEERYQTTSELIVELRRSGLEAPVLSFIDVDVAMQDPLVRARVSSVNETTQMDPLRPHRVPADDVWYVRIVDPTGQVRKVQMTKSQMLSNIREGTLSRTITASTGEKGPFRNLHAYPTFRDALRESGTKLKVQPDESADGERTAPTAYPWWVLAAVLLALLWLTAGFIYWLLT
jgi:serine/threonine-protein kinase